MSAPTWKPAPPRVVVVGGGLAGLAAAVALVDKDLDLVLLESRPRLGGRAGSFTDSTSGDLVDNCQHVSMCCCTNLQDFCRRVRIESLFEREASIAFVGPDNSVSMLAPGRLPAPLHTMGSFLKLKFLSLGEKLRIARGLLALANEKHAGKTQSFADWLLEHSQTVRTINLFWSTVLVSALNERLDRMDVGHARKVFIDGFLANPEGSILEIPKVPLGELYGLNLERWLDEHNVNVRLKTGVRSISFEDTRSSASVLLRSGETIEADFVVAAVPFNRIVDLLDEDSQARIPGLGEAAELEASPITGIHFWFDRSVCPLRHAVTVGRTIQWVFNHTLISGIRGPDPNGEYLQLVVSASRDFEGMSQTEIRDIALEELRELWPKTKEANLVRWRVVTEHGATFAVRPGVEDQRPAQRTPIDGFFLSGDWTDTGWPATMEGAVRSGYLAAEGILDDLGRTEKVLAPDLLPTPLARLLLGIKPSYRSIPGSAETRPIPAHWHLQPD